MAQFDLGAILYRAKRALERPNSAADAPLLARFVRERDGAAFTELVARHGPAVWAACRRGTANMADAEDVFQATFLVLARRADRVRRAASVGSWLFGTAVRLARKARTRSTRVPDPTRLTPPADLPDPAAGAAWREVLTVLDEELARLPDRLRAPLLCCYFDGLTQDEAAARLGWKVRTVKARVARGRTLLRSRLARRGVDLSAALAAAALVKEGLSTPPAGTVLGLTQAAPGYAGRGPVADTISVTAQALAREGLLMTRRKLAPILLTAGAVALVAVGAGYVVGQAPKSPPPPGPGPVAPAPAAPVVAAKTDLAGDPLPAGAVARLGTTRYRLRGQFPRNFFLGDGSRLLSLAQARVTVTDVETGKATDSFQDPDLQFASESDLSPDGTRLAGFAMVRSAKGPPDQVVRVYDLTARKTLWAVPPEGAVRGSSGTARFTPDGKRLLTLWRPGDVRVWDAATGAELRREKVPGDSYGLQLSPDGKTVALTGRDLRVWDWAGDRPPRKIEVGSRGQLRPVQFSADGKTVYVFGQRGLAPNGYDVATGRPTGPLVLGGLADWFSLSPDGKTVAYGSTLGRLDALDRAGEIVLWNQTTGKELRRLSAPPAQPSGAQWSKDGSRLASFTEQRVCVFDVKTGKLLGPNIPGHDRGIRAIAFAPDGRVFTCGYDRTVRAWDPATGKPGLTLLMDTGNVLGLAVSADGSLVAASGLRNDFPVWDAKTGKEVFRLRGHGETGGVRKLRFSADDQTLLSWGDDWYLRAFDTLTGKLKSEHSFIPKEFLDKDDPKVRMLIEYGEIDPLTADLSPDGKTLVLAKGKDVFAYAADTSKERFKIEADPKRVENVALSADGKWLATAGPGDERWKVPGPGGSEEWPPHQVVIRNMATVATVARFRFPTAGTKVAVLAFTPDGRRVVTASVADAELRFWDAKTGEPAGTLGLPYHPQTVAFSPDGKLLAIGFLDTTALVYDVEKALKPAKQE
ncbi:MAG: sigma-70 family RNA polymerase sigma factor [Zavarzinella sp.]|nr:sigma-70 family RNA polymerase sigma factor [Zavarzinella sp.]